MFFHFQGYANFIKQARRWYKFFICFRTMAVHIRRRQWHSTPVLLPGKSHGQRSLVGSSPWGREESDMTERLHFHFSLSCIGEGNGNPFQCSAWRIPGMGEPGGQPSMGSHRVGHDWSDLAAVATATWWPMAWDLLRDYLHDLKGQLLCSSASFVLKW